MASVPEPFHLWMALAPQPAAISSMVFFGANPTGPQSANFASTVITSAISSGAYSGSGPFYVQNSIDGYCYQYMGTLDPSGNQVWTLAAINNTPYNGVVEFAYGQAGGYPLCSTPAPIVSYNCTPSGCIDPGNGSGTYSTLATCQNDCRFRCISNNCVQAAGGSFTSLNDCINSGCNTSWECQNGNCVNIPGNSGYATQALCQAACTPPLPTYYVCDNPNTAAFWQFGYDCSGLPIPASVIANPSTANIISQPSCCPSCISIYANSPTASGYSSQPLTCTVNGVNPTTINGTDGYISITVRDGGFTASGVPQGLITGNSTYKYVLENNNPAATISGNAAGVKVGSGTAGVSQASFTFGNSLTIAANGGNGLLQTGAAGSATYVATSALGYVPAATGTLNTTGLQAGTYTVYVYDSSQKTPCLCKSIVTLTNPTAINGCTDPTSLTYNAAATINTASACQYCDAITGTLENNAGTVIPHMSVTGSPYISNPVTSSVATNGSINITGVNAIAPFTTYVNNVTDAGTLLPNADYKISLHRWNTQTSTANSAWAGPTLTNFNSNTSLIGTVNNQGLGFNNVLLNTASLGGGITYGYYTIKFYIDDPDGTVEIEQCYYLLDVVVKVPVCYDNGIATTIDGVVITDPNLYVIDNTICLSINNYCCQSATFAETTSYGCNVGIYTATVSCNPLPSTISYGVEMLNPSTGLWNIVLPLSLPQVFASSPFSVVGTFMQNVVSANGYGTFRMVFVSSYGPVATPTSNPCTIYSNNVVISPAITGCTDPTALNYTAAASCPGPCTYCVYGCMDPLALNYDPNATCDDGSCTYPIPGCMDPTASNYNPLATVDDGSCIYASCGCTDPTALNYGKNCLGNYVGLPPSCDDGCCQYCDPASISSTTTIVPATTLGTPQTITITTWTPTTNTLASQIASLGLTDSGIVTTALGEYVLYDSFVTAGTTTLVLGDYYFEETGAQVSGLIVPGCNQGPNGGLISHGGSTQILMQGVHQAFGPVPATVDVIVAFLNTHFGVASFTNTMSWQDLNTHSYTLPGYSQYINPSTGNVVPNISLSRNYLDCDPTPIYTSYTTTDTCESICDASFTITLNSTVCTSVWHLIDLKFYSNVSNSWESVAPPGVYAYGVPVTFSNLCAENYILSIKDCYGCPVDIPISIGTNNPACGCTDPNADNYNPSATLDDGSCMFCGCMDPNASNYNPGATSPCIPEICEYVAPSSPCVPGTIEETFLLFEECIAVNGTSYYNKLITGLADECSTMNTWKLILMDYLLKRVGLECIYNCLDSGTPTPDNAYNTCEDLWITGGPSTGLNDLSVNTLGIGTTITDFSATSTSTLYPGDVIKHGTSGNIWLFYGPPGQTSMQLLDPESASGGISGFWMYCNNNMRYTFKGYNINYLDSFINFVNKFCSDCKNNVINRKSKYYLDYLG